MRLLLLYCVSALTVFVSAGSIDDWEAEGCFYDPDHSALPEHFYSPSDLDVNQLWPNLKPLAQACSEQAEIRNFTCFGIQYHQECWGGVNASQTYNISGKSPSCKVGVDGYGVGKLYTTFVYKLKSVDGNWTSWSKWHTCSKTCGNGFQKRMRNCTNPAPANGGRPCNGISMETKICTMKPCPVDGGWASWSDWTPCSQTCGGGFQKRMRNCTNPLPANSGKTCKGVAMETKKCNLKPCPVDGLWGSWTKWSECSVTCKGEVEKRRRSCNNPLPQHGGKDCTGVSMVTRSCKVRPCPVNGQWSSWTKWSACSVTCKGGVQRRRRSCNNPSPQHGGKDCLGVSMVTRACNVRPCPVNGQWGSWTKWSACSVTCKGGFQRRRRSCNNPRPQYGGKGCFGVSVVTRSCNVKPCPVNGGWNSWSSWGRCGKTCGGGSQLRYRQCTRPPPQYNGKPCVGRGVQSRSCNTDSCPPGQQALLCESHMGVLLSCGLFRRIRIHWVHYGYISGEHACGITHMKTCSAPNALNVVRAWCEGKAWCVIKPWNLFFGAPCGGNRRYLKFYHSC